MIAANTWSPRLPLRIAFLIILFSSELIAFSIAFDTIALRGAHGFAEIVGDALAITLRGVVLFSLAGLLFGNSALTGILPRLAGAIDDSPISFRMLAVHAVCTLLLAASAVRLFAPGTPNRDFFAIAALVAGIGAVASALLAMLPARFWLALLLPARDAVIYAAFVAMAALLMERLWRFWWRPLTTLTFQVVKACLDLTGVPTVAQFKPDYILGTARFQVEIARACSGIEGISMMLAFATAWLWFFRKECRFPQAFLLLPAGVTAIWCTNVLRITALILIGNAGWETVAVGGFHSQAGWIGFIATAIGFTILFQRLPWIRKTEPAVPETVSALGQQTAAYLLPFLGILAAGIVGWAFSAGTDWLYPLRVFAALIALWIYRRVYVTLDWRPSWIGALAGVAVFGMWLGLERIWPGARASWPPVANAFWLSMRVFGTVITVPIAEELAFRSYLLRRLQSASFESVNTTQWTWIALLISSAIFGLMHGDRWVAGTMAGVVYAAVFLRRGGIGDAVLAHGTTNALLAAWVLSTGQWQFW